MAAPSLAVIFNNVDADRSGRISADELQRALSNGTWTPFNPETCRLMIGMFDSDRDGAINFAEFSALWEYVNQWTQCFRSFDRDGSGNIDKDELSAALRQFGYRLSERFIDLLMIKFDRTHTHRVNFDDFIQLCVVLQTLTASFRDKDADRDGVITVGYEEFLTMAALKTISYSRTIDEPTTDLSDVASPNTTEDALSASRARSSSVSNERSKRSKKRYTCLLAPEAAFAGAT